MTTLKNELRDLFHEALSYVKIDIDNCPETLWEKKYGGDYYWQQVFHAVASTAGMLQPDTMDTLHFPIPAETVFLEPIPGMPAPIQYTGPHGKDIMYKTLDIVKKYLDTYFETLNANELFQTVDFFGTEMSLFKKINALLTHIWYHVGVFDAALRDHGAKASM